MMPHTINRLTVELQLKSQEGSFLLQKTVQQAVYRHLLPALDKMLTAEFTTNDSILVDTLTLDMGKITADALGQVLAIDVRAQLQSQLALLLRDVSRDSPTDLRLIDKHSDIKHSDDKTTVQHYTPKQQTIMQLQHYLLYGVRPWWCRQFNLATGLMSAMNEQPKSLLNMLMPIINHTKPSAKDAACRLVALLSEQNETLVDLFLLFIEQNQVEQQQIAQKQINAATLSQAVAKIKSFATPEQAFICYGEILLVLAKTALQSMQPESLNTVLNATIERLHKQPITMVKRVNGRTVGIGEQSKNTTKNQTALQPMKPEPLNTILNNTKQPIALAKRVDGRAAGIAEHSENTTKTQTPLDIKTDNPTGQVNNLPGGSEDVKTNTITANKVLNPTVQLNTGPLKNHTDTLTRDQPPLHCQVQHQLASLTEPYAPEPYTSEQDTFYVNNAGLVLLWPFLTRLFERLGLSQGKQLNHKSHALLILHQLLYEHQPQSEDELLLAKILCHQPLRQATVLAFTPTPEQDFAINELLQAAISHWSALGKVSGNWLQQVFLQRFGVLKRQQNGWLLQVEGTPPDVLLNKLSWSISTVKLPWMPQALSVQWAY